MAVVDEWTMHGCERLNRIVCFVSICSVWRDIDTHSHVVVWGVLGDDSFSTERERENEKSQSYCRR